MLRNFWRDEQGQDLVEYALVVGILALGTITLMNGAATQINLMWTNLVTNLTTAATATTP